ncbi:MAG: sialate O-acetylesterase, partial [Candidatus Latescibacterota bacterium]
IGEVWIGSGQSNMQWPVQAVVNAEAEIAAADHPQIRLFTVPRVTAFAPQEDTKGRWQRCTPETVPGFSAVAFFFGRQIQQELGVPVGLINSSWGGTIIEAWMDRASLEEAGVEAEGLAAMEEAQARLPELLAAKEAAQRAVVQALTDDGPAVVEAVDDGWATMEVPAQWEQAGLPGFDGLVWFRKVVDLPASWAGRDLVLHLGPVDEIDDTFFNGVRIGGLGSFADGVVEYWDDSRVYPVPGRLVRAGRNHLAVRALDTAMAGGLWGARPEEMFLQPAGGAGSSDEDVRLSVAGAWRYRPGPVLPQVPTLDNPNQPTVLYNAMIHPLIPFSLRGALWYQGESNRGQGLEYEQRMRCLINGWRRLWEVGSFPFLYVQLAPFRYGDNPELLGAIWEAQRRVLTLPNTGMAVTTDIGDLDDIHPVNKQEVGRRLALWALARTYGRPNLVCSGPLVTRATAEGNSLRLAYDGTGSGLASRDGQPLTWFEVAGADGRFHPATARIDGSAVVLTSPAVTTPVQARFAWNEEAVPNLINREGLPASPFLIEAR